MILVKHAPEFGKLAAKLKQDIRVYLTALKQNEYQEINCIDFIALSKSLQQDKEQWH